MDPACRPETGRTHPRRVAAGLLPWAEDTAGCDVLPYKSIPLSIARHDLPLVEIKTLSPQAQVFSYSQSPLIQQPGYQAKTSAHLREGGCDLCVVERDGDLPRSPGQCPV